MSDTLTTFRYANLVAAVIVGGLFAITASLAFRGFEGRSSAIERMMRCRMAPQTCPTCGLTRSVLATFRGEFKTAREWHAAGPGVVLFALAQWALRFVMARVTRLWVFYLDLTQFVAGWICVARIGWGAATS